MYDLDYSMAALFAQLGLDNDEVSIEAFIAKHQLAPNTILQEAAFWTTAQRAFLTEEGGTDTAWSLTVDELNARLHEQCQSV